MVNGRFSIIFRGFASALVVFACNAIIGIDEPTVVGPKSSDCILNSDCPKTAEVCLFEICSPPCDADRDCDGGARCLVTNLGRACVVTATAICSKKSDCPAGTFCSNGACRNACGNGCLDDQSCNASEMCFGTSSHEGVDAAGGGEAGGSVGGPATGHVAGNSGESTSDSGAAGSIAISGGSGFGAGTGGDAGIAGGVAEGGSFGTAIGSSGAPNGGSPNGGTTSIGATTAGTANVGIGVNCIPEKKQCNNLVVETCIDDVWTPTGNCPYRCSDGLCTGECIPDSEDCRDLIPRHCSSVAQWVEGVPCSKVCEHGVCVDRCSEGTLSCNDGDLYECGADGAWALAEPCAIDCVNGHCTECTPPSEECVDNLHRTCTSNGTWDAGFTCATTCVGDDCAACVPSAEPTKCLDNVPQYCDATGNWKSDATACGGATPYCLDGKCVACSPRSVDCLDSNTPRSCDSAGQWQLGADCAGLLPACVGGKCVDCSPGTQRCANNSVETCSAEGRYANPQSCGTQACVLAGTSASCQGSCTPGSKRCNNNAVETCSSAGVYGGASVCSGKTCVVSGSDASCLGSCAPNQIDCLDANTPRSCSPVGQWQNGSDCAGNTPICLSGACVQCSPNSTPTTCTSSCSRTPVHCGPSGTWVNDANCGAGNYCQDGACVTTEERVGMFTPTGPSLGGAANIVFAQRVEVSCVAQVMRLGASFQVGGGQIQFGIYDGTATTPGNLLAVSSKVSIQAPRTESSLSSSIALQSGNYYWIAANLSATGGWQVNYESPGSSRYVAYDFASHSPALPMTMELPSTYTSAFDFYAVVVRNP